MALSMMFLKPGPHDFWLLYSPFYSQTWFSRIISNPFAWYPALPFWYKLGSKQKGKSFFMGTVKKLEQTMYAIPKGRLRVYLVNLAVKLPLNKCTKNLLILQNWSDNFVVRP